MTTVVASDSGFVAGGSSGPELADRHAAFWTSADGSTWHAVPDDPGAFANAEVVVRRRFTNNRVTAAPLEDRAVLSDFDAEAGQLTHHTSSQLPHVHARARQVPRHLSA